jgi:hypothetical protein
VCASAGPYIVCTERGMAVIPISCGTGQAYRLHDRGPERR